MEEEGLMEQVVRSTFWNFSTMLISKIGSLIFTIILARILLPELFGLYGLVMSIALIFIILADLGINQTLIRYVSTESEKNKEKSATYFRYLFKIKILLAIFISSALLVLAYPLSYYLYRKPDLFIFLVISAFYVFTSVMISSIESLFYVFKKLKLLTIKEFILQSLKIALVVLVSLFLTSSLYIQGVLIGLILTNLIALILLLFFLNRFSKNLFKKSKETIDKKRVLNFLGYSSLAIISAAIFSYIDVVILGIFVKSEFIGFYKAAITLVFSLIGLLNFYYVFLPIFTQAEDKKLNYIFNTLFRYVAIIGIPASIGLILLGNYFVVFIYGYPYLTSASFLYILAPLIFTELFAALVSLPFIAREKPDFLAKTIVFAALLNITLNFALIIILLPISEFAATMGAAIATLFSRTLYLFGLIYLAKTKLKIKIEFKHLVKPFIASLIMALFIFLTNHFFIEDMSLISGAVEVIFGVLIYFIALFLMKGINKGDINLINFLKPKSRTSQHP